MSALRSRASSACGVLAWEVERGWAVMSVGGENLKKRHPHKALQHLGG